MNKENSSKKSPVPQVKNVDKNTLLASVLPESDRINTVKTIFVEIPAYKDPDLMNTVNSAILQADRPERVFFGVCYQDDDTVTLEKLKGIDNMRVIHVPLKEARGSCYARYLCQTMLENEDYIMHIDSHMRFVKHWDTLIIKELEQFDDPMGYLSTYVYSANDHLTKPLDDPCFDEPPLGVYMVADAYRGTSKRNMLNFHGQAYKGKDDIRIGKTHPFTSGHYLFGPSSMDKEVPFDPDMHFYGDELPMSIRYYTHGYNNYNGRYVYCYHYYNRIEHEMPSNVLADKCFIEECEKFYTMVGITDNPVDLGTYGLGTVRTVGQYELFAGVDFKHHKLSYESKRGIYDKFHSREELEKMCMSNRQSFGSRIYCAKELSDLYICIVDLHGSGAVFIESACKLAYNKSRLHFIVASPYASEQQNHTSVEVTNNVTYGHLIAAAFDALPVDLDENAVVMFVNAETQVVRNWDSYLLEEMEKVRAATILTEFSVLHKYGEIDTDHPCSNAYLVPYALKDRQFQYGMSDFIPSGASQYDRLWPVLGGDMFAGRLSSFKSVPFDPDTDFLSFIAAYSMRLFTSGFDICYTHSTYFYRFANLFTDNLAYVSGQGFDMHEVMDITTYGPHDYLPGMERSVGEWESYLGIRKRGTYEIMPTRNSKQCIPYVVVHHVTTRK